MTIKNIFKSILFFSLSALILCSCKNPLVYKLSPAHQANTTWSSTDGSITFHMDNNCETTGTITVNEETHDVVIYFDAGTSMHVYSADILEDTQEPYEHENEYYLREKWSCVFTSKSTFYIKVKETTYFEIGDTITFKKVNNTEDEKIVDDSKPPNS